MIEQSLKIFRTAAAVGIFTEAAALSGMTQPNVTKQIANLERELDVKLFRRTGRSVELTPAGETLREECERLFTLEEAYELYREIGAEFKRLFEPVKPTLILTIEASGIALAMTASLSMGIPMVFAKK